MPTATTNIAKALRTVDKSIQRIETTGEAWKYEVDTLNEHVQIIEGFFALSPSKSPLLTRWTA